MRILCWLAVMSFCGTALAAGVREPAIGIDFPERLGDFALKGRTQFPRAGEGAVISYESREARGAVYVYNAGRASIPTGVGDRIIQKHFLETAAALQQAARESSGSARPVRSSTISAFPGCGPQFLWRADALSMGGKSVVTRTYLTGLKNNFVKLRVTHARGDEEAADDFVQRIRRVLGACAR